MKGLEEAEKALASFFDAASAEAEARPAPGVLEALADDLNTPQAIAEMHALKQRGRPQGAGRDAGVLRLPRRARSRSGARRARRRLRCAPDEIDRRIAARLDARKAKNFAEADRIRDELAAHGRGAEGLQGRHDLGARAMMARAHPTFALRPFLIEDTPLLAEIFRASIAELTADDYSERQQEAWIRPRTTRRRSASASPRS